MEKINEIEIVSKLIDGKEYNNYGKIFYSSSENLDEIFNVIDVKDKNVLTIMGSSDQYFYAYYYGARNVDSFDINKFSKYYYYLRLWGINYLDEFYPDLSNHKYIYSLLKLVKCNSEDEEEAYSFWNNYIRYIFPFDNENFFYVGSNILRDIDINKLKNVINGKSNNFYHTNIKDKFTDSKYDVIMLSNMLEFCSDYLYLTRDNLYNLLSDNGIVVCSNILTDGFMENRVFSSVFYKNSLGDYKNKNLFGIEFPLGYVYKKKC